MGGIGPMLGQANHFRGQAPDNEYGVRRYTNEAGRLYGVMDKRLADHEYLAGEYSIADIACYPWLQGHEKQGQNLDDFPHVKRWFKAVTARPGVQRGLQIMADVTVTPMDDKAREIMYGARQYERW